MKNKILIYDDNCPLCTWYTAIFVKYGLLPAEGRKPFSTLDPSLLSVIDLSRGRNEIPLLDTDSRQVLYGIEALLEIIGGKFPLLKKIAAIKPVNYLIRRLYKFISYNRKVIVAKRCGPGNIDCSPDLNYFYRYLFMFVFLSFNSLMLFPLHKYVLTHLSYYHLSITGLQTAHFALVFTNCILALGFTKNKAVEYLGQVNMLALTSILLVSPLLLFSVIEIQEWIVTAWLLLVTVIIFKEYLRRMEYASVLTKNKWVASINLVSIAGFLMFLFR